MSGPRGRLLFPLAYWLFWVVVFEVARGLFLLYHARLTAALPLADVWRTLAYGARLDVSLAAYFSIPAAVGLALARQLPPGRLVARLLAGYTYALLALVLLVIVVDMELYGHWGFRIDTTLFQYLNTPREMAASAGSAPVGWLVALYVGLVVVGIWCYRRTLGRAVAPPAASWRDGAIALLTGALLVLPMRGGWQQIPVNQSDVYFSNRPFANHAAVNAGWNLLYYALRGESGENPYQYLADSAARREVAALYEPARQYASAQLLTTRRPNVLLVILESFTSKLVGCTGGEKGITPTLDSLAADGVLFDSIYAAGNRSEKGLVAILSGFPSQTTTSLTRVPRKAEKLPHLARRLAAQGYRTAYWYGGELTFANIKAYVLSAGYERVVEKKDFPPATYNSKWGVHDHLLLARLGDSLLRARAPWFTTVFTLSSHEPYDVPGKVAFPGVEEADRFRNSMHYTDHAVGHLLRRLRADQPLWDSTLVVLVADHGHPLPDHTPEHDPAMYRIPLVLTGGALRPEWRGRKISQIGSQTDLLATLLTQLGQPTKDLTWSRDLLAPLPAPFAFYVFNDGFGMVTKNGVVSFDNVGHRPILYDPTVPRRQLRQGQALMQETFADFLRR